MDKNNKPFIVHVLDAEKQIAEVRDLDRFDYTVCKYGKTVANKKFVKTGVCFEVMGENLLLDTELRYGGNLSDVLLTYVKAGNIVGEIHREYAEDGKENELSDILGLRSRNFYKEKKLPRHIPKVKTKA